jgi:hypothetical protein
MHRRDFLISGAQAAAAGAALSATAESHAAAAPIPAAVSGAPAVLRSYTAADHRRRLENIAICTRDIRQCLRKHLVTD